jgi:hypothetical protein
MKIIIIIIIIFIMIIIIIIDWSSHPSLPAARPLGRELPHPAGGLTGVGGYHRGGEDDHHPAALPLLRCGLRMGWRWWMEMLKLGLMTVNYTSVIS